ncbi:MAG: hypothetical protein ACXVCM_17100, partial [Ktedonobacteraceae bacterium]
DNLVDEYKKPLTIADLPDIRFHDVRHRAAMDPHGEKSKSASFLHRSTSFTRSSRKQWTPKRS